MLRRDLLKMGSAATLGLIAPPLLPGSAAPSAQGSATLAWDRCLVLIELSGGNDGLNTVVPYADPDYYRLRPTIAIPASALVTLDAALGLHPALRPLASAWQEGELAIALGLGCPNPSRSHVRAIDTWNGGVAGQEPQQDGWLARILAGARGSAPAELLAHSISLGYGPAYGAGGALGGHQLTTLAVERPEAFVARAMCIPAPGAEALRAAQASTRNLGSGGCATAERLAALYRTAPALDGFPATGLGAHLQLAAALIAAGIRCPVFTTTVGGYDTHAGQPAGHRALLSELGGALGAFRAALKRVPGAWERTLVMTCSEFGRRAGENDSGGTDHGTAAPQLLMGGAVRGGFYGTQPSLGRLDHGGDLVASTDFRQLYQSVAQGWFGYHQPFLSETGFTPLPLLR